MRRRKLSLCFVTMLLSGLGAVSPASAQQTEDQPPEAVVEQDAPPSFTQTMTVIATHAPVSLEDSGRHVEVITGEELEAQGVRSIPEALQLIPGLDVRRRGVWGMQADLSIRGSSFEQVLVLVDGMPVNNPQTGHHTLDLPIPISAIDHIEVLFGPGSALHGADASGGVVQIFTRQGMGRGVTADVFSGEHSLSGGRIDASLSKKSAQRISIERAESSGYKKGTEFDRTSGWYTGRFGDLRVSAGASSHDFGAQDFYSTSFPNQLEFTDAALLNLRWSRTLGAGTWTVRTGARQHKDLFILDRHDPSLLTNRHRDNGYDLTTSYRTETALGVLDLGASAVREHLDSTNLGIRTRDRWGLYSSLVGDGQRLDWRLAVHADRVEGRTEVHPNIALSTPAGPGRLRVAASSAFRIPSFTELYYTSPASVGNPALRPEHTTSYELGYDWVQDDRRLSATAFLRRGSDLIDFVQSPGDIIFKARNLRRVNTNGLELSGARSIRLARARSFTVTTGYTWLHSSGDQPAGVSAYVFDYLEHRALLRGQVHGFGPIDLGAAVSWNQRHGQKRYVRLDANLRLRPQGRSWELYVAGTNLGSVRYFEQGGIEMPRRWLTGGLRYHWD